MRSALLALVPEAQVLDGAAEEMPLPSAIADAVVAAQAFHWFANARAVREIARVLSPEGVLILVWNTKDSQDPLMETIDAILAPYRLGSPGFASTRWREVFEGEHSPLSLASHDTFSFEERLTLGQLKGRVLSASYIALLEKRLQSAVVLQLEELVEPAANDRALDDATIVMHGRTEVFVARRK